MSFYDDPVWVIEDPDDPSVIKKKRQKAAAQQAPQQNPALAFSLSMLVWGAGQLYNRQGKIGTLLMLLMANFYLAPISAWIYWDALASAVSWPSITPFQFMATLAALYFVGLAIWLCNAEYAYRAAARTRTKAFHGVDNRWLPAVCSLIIPGWGQFLNGQTGKGVFYLVFALMALFAIPVLLVTPTVWPALDSPTDRLLWERICVALLLVAPLATLMWLFSSFDALKVSLDEMKKEPLIKRLEYANNRRRMYGWVRGVFPSLKATFLLGLFLLSCAIIAHYVFPREYYVASLQHLQVKLSQQDTVLLPGLIDRFLHDVFRAQ